MNDFNQKIIDEFRSNKGKVGGMFEGMELLLVTTKGAKSGKEVIFPVAYTKDGDKYVIVASKGGAPENPAWYYNLLANPEVMVEVGTEKFKARAKDTKDAERERLFDQHAKQYPTFNDYKAKTTRIIPVFTLEKI
jgi:deazaflavin-dependent oxidoreductase (nitroreductase family)